MFCSKTLELHRNCSEQPKTNEMGIHRAPIKILTSGFLAPPYYKRGAKQKADQLLQWGFWVNVRNIGLFIMQTMSYVLGRGNGKNDHGPKFPVEVWNCTPKNWWGVKRERED